MVFIIALAQISMFGYFITFYNLLVERLRFLQWNVAVKLKNIGHPWSQTKTAAAVFVFA